MKSLCNHSLHGYIHQAPNKLIEQHIIIHMARANLADCFVLTCCSVIMFVYYVQTEMRGYTAITG